MRKLVLLLVFLVLAKMDFAQSVFAPIGSYWTYNLLSHSSAYNGDKTLYYVGDSIVNGRTVKKICSASYTYCLCPDPPMYYSYCYDYIIERNDSVFSYDNFNDSLILLYAFNMNIGDSIVYNAFSPSGSYKSVLDSAGTGFICGQTRMYLYYTKYQQSCTEPLTVVSGIGPIDNYLMGQAIYNCDMGPGAYLFNCVNIVTDAYPSGNCANRPFALKENAKLKYTLMNTPTGIGIQFSEPLNGTIIISNILGSVEHREQLDHQSSFEFNTNQLAKGIYLFTVSGTNGKSLSGKFIVE